ncbi:urocanate reductase precursor [Oxobacter pfennigii]|uniref:Urocanate reductase n=1 Tax=Oxobacter pfennigii TaxID=36849 RepID=A0A0P8WZ57_9CLOT|nr:FAD-dependent oxidoreductase [Oxobacter pfennigii]KPU43753.1 urocanate reductase precursor [Oxobacter pfennigii]
MKRFISMLLCICILIAIAGCTDSKNGQGENKDKNEIVNPINGNFEGTANGMQGPITVSITVKDSKITAIEFKKNSETPNVAVVAVERIPKQIIEHQSLSVDTVTGATLASYGIINAVANAAKAAGLDVDALKANKVTAQPKEPQTWDTDVLVMGGGGAGLSAAINAAEQGAKVILIEKGSVLGGNTMMAGAAYNAVDPGAQSVMILTKSQKATMDGYLALDPADPKLKFDVYPEWQEVLTELKADIKAFYAKNAGKEAGVDMPGFDSVSLHMWHVYTGGLRQLTDGTWIAPSIVLARKFANSALDSFVWMGEAGLNSSYGADAKYGGAPGLGTVLGAMWPRTHSFMSGAERIPQLEKVAKEKGVKIYTETRGTELLTDASGKVVGAKAEQADGTNITVNTAKGVVLATGGYSANAAMVKKYDKYWGKDLSDTTLSTNMGTNEGDGIIMAETIGAELTGMEVAQMMPSSSPIKGTMTDGIWADASEQIWIDGKGNRFVNEYAERDVLAKTSLALEDGIFYIIYAGRGDANKPEQLIKGTKYDERVAAMVEGGHIWYGNTLAELAEATKKPAAGVAPAFTEEQLRATIEKYNSYVAAQKDDDFGKEVISGAIDLDYIDSDDEVGICISPRKSSLHHTMGGVVIDTEAHVINKDGKIIPGLWAAGEVTGGLHAGNRLGGNAIADIFTFGRIAGINAATGK